MSFKNIQTDVKVDVQCFHFNRVMIFRLSRKSIKLITLYVAYLQQNTQKV